MSLTTHHLYFDEVEVGQEWESPGRTITEADVTTFASFSGDFSPIHVDRAFAAATPFRRPIAHGLLVLSIDSGLSLLAPPVRTQAFLGIRRCEFKGPVFIGDTIRVRTKVVEKEPRSRGRRGMIVWQRQILNQDGKVVQDGVTCTLVEGRGAAESTRGQLRGERDQMVRV
ncbi:MAG: MaoC family dehydratase N-terminal domain-containing protein [Gemmataceae bacterium]|nr:MaoC family dehydratase N-terminal domain-containing protein [Gemmataceae bacterium]